MEWSSPTLTEVRLIGLVVVDRVGDRRCWMEVEVEVEGVDRPELIG